MNIPKHIAIILDGNGRWAKAKGLPRKYGHIEGAKTVEVICEEAYKMGVQYLTVYAFSTENWNRPKDEVEALMTLLRNYMKTCLKTAEKNRMCGRDEIVRATKNIAERIKNGELKPDDITEELISESLDTRGIPEPDLLIRTCNEQRISNFLLWQLAYTEFYFTDVAWPDFSKEELTKAIEAYNKRDRKYGLVKED